MSILTNALPIAAEINGHKYALNTDFRTIINIIRAYDDPELASIEKQRVLLANLFYTMPEPDDLPRAAEIAVDFIAGGHERVEKAESGSQARYYSFEKDANLIFAAFQQTHGIDLQSVEHLHWWKFMALFGDLGSTTAFCNLVGLRRRVAKGEASKEDYKMKREMGDAFDVGLTVPLTIEEIEAERMFFALIDANKEKTDA